MYPSLRSHEIEDLSRRYRMKLQALTNMAGAFFMPFFRRWDSVASFFEI